MLVSGVAVKECVLSYVSKDGTTTREFVPLKTIRDSAAGIAHLPVCLHHPDGKVTRDNVGELAVGNVDSEVLIEDGGYTTVRMAIRRGDAQDAVTAGTQELSLSYEAQLDPTPGEHPVHGKYDAVQISRRYDHLALVDQARVGPDARIRFDGIATTTIRADAAPPHPGNKAHGAIMNTGFLSLFALLGLAPRRCDSDDAAISAIEGALRARKDAEEAAAAAAEEEEVVEEAEAADAKKKFDELQAAYDAMKAEFDAMKSAAAVDADKADRAALAPLCVALKIDAAQHPSTKALRKAIATAHTGGKLRADASDHYVDAVVDLAQQALTAKGDGRESGSKAWVQPPQDGETHADSQGQIRLSPLQKAQAARQKRLAGGAS